jgi:hypothetical protein
MSWGLTRDEQLLSLSISASLCMSKQISFMMTLVVMLTAFVTIAVNSGSERAQAAGANMTNATAAAQPK